MRQTLSLEAQAIWKVLVVGLILGAGLPALFALGIRSLAYGQGGEAEAHGAGTPTPHPLGRAIGVLCFAIVVVAVALGILFIVVSGFGKQLSFSNIYPTIIDK